MRNIMYDVEAMGVSPHGALVSIGACVFEPMSLIKPTETFYVIVDSETWERFGQKKDRKVEEWWSKQSKAVRAVLEDPEIPPEPFDKALQMFRDWVIGDQEEEYTLWSNTGTYDANMIQFSLKDARLPLFHHNAFKNCRDIFWILIQTGEITYYDINQIKKNVYMKNPSLKHHAKDDAVRQAILMQNCLAYSLRNIVKKPQEDHEHANQ